MSAQATVIQERSEIFAPASRGGGIAGRIASCAKALQERMQSLRNEAGPRLGADRWIVENYSYLAFQVRELRETLTARYVRKLRRAGAAGSEPRIYSIAAKHLTEFGEACTEDLSTLEGAVREEQSLKLRELWAYGAMLKLALIERLCANLHSETTVAASIRAVRALESASWRDFVESVSRVEAVLRADPAGVYAEMDFDTRDRYRQRVEKLARWSGRTEAEVAEAAVDAAGAGASANGAGDITAHVGYHLIGAGAAKFSRAAGCGRSLRAVASLAVQRWPGVTYASGLVVVAALLGFGFERLAGGMSVWIWALLAIPISQAALEIVNSIISYVVKPQAMPSLKFSDAIPESCETMVVVPSLVLSSEVAARLVEDLEIRYLANRDPNLLFGLLTDFPDARDHETEADSVLEVCVKGIERLNARYGAEGRGPFYLFHRGREWNASEGKWIGYERKRGKIHVLNRLLLGRGNGFDVTLGDQSRFAGVRYVITLDADTQLPRDSAAKLIAAMAHPLNRPVLDEATGVVRRGYGLIRPRVSTSMVSAGRSLFAQIFSGMAGFDPYAITVSDVYQDLFERTSYTGKGIYDVHAFEAAVGERFPENAILSHDLIEGEHVRVGFCTGAELVEDYPASYQAFSKRKHRWVRGDWQLLPWLFPTVKTRGNAEARNPLDLLARWKLFDNLRRSLVEIALVLLLAAGWIFSNHPLRWTLLVLALIQIPVYADIMLSMTCAPQSRLWRAFLEELGGQFVRRHRDTLLNLVFLPHQALLMCDAIMRTLARRFITHRNLLEWETMAQSQAGRAGIGVFGAYFYVACAAAMGLLVFVGPRSLAICLICELWIAAPLIAHWLNMAPPRPTALSESSRGFLRETALRTWRYFADHQDAEHHWLIPDNAQQDPPMVAHRISPTNLGLQLTAQLAAHDFGYMTLGEFSVSLGRIFDSMAEMPRHRGHFLNWYETANLKPIAPQYVSSVDSGNLAASLCALRQGTLGLKDQPWMGPHVLAGIRDHVLTIRHQLPYGLRSVSLVRSIASLLRQLETEPGDLFAWEAVLTEVSRLTAKIHDSVRRSCARHAGARDEEKWIELAYWNDRLAERVEQALGEFFRLAPWLTGECTSELRVNCCNPSFAALMAEMSPVTVLTGLPRQYERVRERLIERLSSSEPLYPALRGALERLSERLSEAEGEARGLIGRLERICSDAFRYFEDMDFAFLLEKNRKMLRIGMDVTSGIPDEACYDLLASEARTAVFLAIAKGQIPRESWFRLGRKITAYRHHRTLVSWSGTMFEYLMPLLHMRSYGNTLLDRAVRGTVKVQQVYARERKIPWGISESAHSDRDGQMQYQYRAFGIAAICARSDRSQSTVVAPYASMLALMVAPAEATANLQRMASHGCVDRYGFFEAADYCSRGKGPGKLIRSFMAHHQGMGLLAIDNALFDGRMQERFHADPLVQSTEFLLEERMPALVDVVPAGEDLAAA